MDHGIFFVSRMKQSLPSFPPQCSTSVPVNELYLDLNVVGLAKKAVSQNSFN